MATVAEIVERLPVGAKCRLAMAMAELADVNLVGSEVARRFAVMVRDLAAEPGQHIEEPDPPYYSRHQRCHPQLRPDGRPRYVTALNPPERRAS